MALNLDVAFTLATSIEILVYGIYATLFFFTLSVMRKHGLYSPGSGRGWIFLYSTILMFTLATAHIGLIIHRFLQAYITKPGPLIGVGYMFNAGSWDSILHNSMFCVMTWTGDILLIYRCYVVWNRNIWIAGIPTVVLIIAVGLNVYVIHWFARTPDLTVKTITTNWIIDLVYPVALTKNMFSTGLIAWKIWVQHLSSKTQGVIDQGSRLTLIGVLRIVIESAMIYTLQILVLMILNFSHNNAQFIVQALVIPSIGIVFALISLRVHYAKTDSWRSDGTELDISPGWLRDTDSVMEFSPRNTLPPDFLAFRISGEHREISIPAGDLEKFASESSGQKDDTPSQTSESLSVTKVKTSP